MPDERWNYVLWHARPFDFPVTAGEADEDLEPPLDEDGQLLDQDEPLSVAVQGVPDDFDLNEGVSRETGWTPHASLHVRGDRRWPAGAALPDNLDNIRFLQIVSARVVELLRREVSSGIEYLPAAAVNTDGTRLGPYFIAHPVDPVDCLDATACIPTRSKIDGGINRVQKLRFLPSVLGGPYQLAVGRRIFRASGYYRVTFVERTLAEAIDAAGLTGFRWVEIADHPRTGASAYSRREAQELGHR